LIHGDCPITARLTAMQFIKQYADQLCWVA
jgi:hypothetical protein